MPGLVLFVLDSATCTAVRPKGCTLPKGCIPVGTKAHKEAIIAMS